jgi:aminopeptidase N
MSPDKLTREEATRRARLLTNLAYDVSLDLTTDDETFASDTRVRFSCREPGASTFIDLDAAAVARVELNGRALPADAFAGHRIQLADLAGDNELRVVARCRYRRTGVGLHRFADPVDGRVYLHSQFEPFDAHRVFACFDQPDLKAPFTFAVRAPAGWRVLSNSPADGGGPADGWWRFPATRPLPPYITAVVAGPYTGVTERHGEAEFGIWCRESLARFLDPDEIVDVTKDGFDYFEGLFDYAYPFGKYDQVFVPEFSAGAMENAGCVTFSEHHVFRSRVTDAARMSRASTVLHELAHMWFGNLVTMRWWDDLWLNESFATYLGTRALAEATRFTDAWADFASGTKAWAYRQDQLPTTHPIAADVPDTDAVRVNFDGITYAKGASVLRQLVAWVGDEAFAKGLRNYFRRHEFGNAELSDFLGALEECCGRDLAMWSKQWLRTAGVSLLRADAPVSGGRYTSFGVVQEAPRGRPTLRDHRVAIGLYHAAGDRLERTGQVFIDVTGDRTGVAELAGQAEADLLLLNDDDLTYAKTRLPERSLATLEQHLSAVSDPLARALCWWSAWDMTRDAGLAARQWVRLVAEHAASESSLSVLQTLLAQASMAIDLYGAPANRKAVRATLADRARMELSAAEPGGDRQLIWARTLVANAARELDLRFAGGLLDGSVRVEGLAVDADFRWHVVESLAAVGVADVAVIAAEVERDPTDIGIRRAASARAARPTAEAKAAAWSALMDDPDLHLATMRAIAEGFGRPGQEDVLRPYVDRYADALGRVWSERSPEEALLLTAKLYPTAVVAEDTVAAADRALERDDVPPPGKRLVAEARDATLRALRPRAADGA